ncbi:MAG: urease accessory protein UreD [Lacisediminihabitans sp.]
MTSIRIHSAPGRARLDLRAGSLVPRVIEQTASSARVALVAGGALLLGGDTVRIDIAVGEGCLLELEDIGGTIAYDADGEPSTWTVDVVVEAGGTLLWHGLPFIVASGAAVARTTRIDLAADARACLRETIILGRDGEAGGHARLRTDIRLADEPLFIEELVIDGDHQIPGVIGDNRVLDSILLAGSRASVSNPQSNVLDFEGPGCLARTLGREAHRASIANVWEKWRLELLEDRL